MISSTEIKCFKLCNQADLSLNFKHGNCKMLLQTCSIKFMFVLQTMLPIIFTYFPAGSSLKSWAHYGQLMRSGICFEVVEYDVHINIKIVLDT